MRLCPAHRALSAWQLQRRQLAMCQPECLLAEICFSSSVLTGAVLCAAWGSAGTWPSLNQLWLRLNPIFGTLPDSWGTLFAAARICCLTDGQTDACQKGVLHVQPGSI